MPSDEPAVQRSRRGPTARVRAAQVLMWTAALTAALAAVSAAADIAATDIPDTGTTLLGDGLLTLVLVAAYVSCRGWRARQQPPHRMPPRCDCPAD